jgi:thiol:disulfide interchange protein DsbC
MRTIGMMLVLSLTMGMAHADPDPAMMAKLKDMYPKTKFQTVNTSELPGVYEVIMGKNVAYVEESGRYFLFGRLYDMKKQRDLTQDRLEVVQKVDVATVNKDWAINIKQGNGSRDLYVFTDPDCPYCKQLEATLSSMDDINVYIFMMPIDSLHPSAKKKSNNVWCAEDRAKAWRELTIKGKEAPEGNCNTPIADIAKVAFDLGINGTPTILSPDGRKLSGARDATAINNWLNQSKQVSSVPKVAQKAEMPHIEVEKHKE